MCSYHVLMVANFQEDKKSKKTSFKDDSNKKMPTDPFDVEGLENVLKTMTNEMADTKKQVTEYSNSKKSFRNFKKKQTSNSQPLNIIPNVESDQDEYEDETILCTDESHDEELVEVHGLLDFIKKKR